MATRKDWAKRVKKWKASGLNASAFALQEGIDAKQLVWWRWKLGSTAPKEPPEAPRFVPVHIVEAPARSVSTPTAIEIVLPNGRTVRALPGFDAGMLEQVLAIADRGDAC